MRILLSESEVAKTIATFYKIKEEYVKTDDEGYYQIDLPNETQITIVNFKDIEEKLNGRSKVD